MMQSGLNLPELLVRLADVNRAELRTRAAAHGLQPVHAQALQFISRANRYSDTPQGLAEYLGLTKGTVSQSLLLLERRGLIERRGDEIDRRLVRLSLTEAGTDLLRQLQILAPLQGASRTANPRAAKAAHTQLQELLARAQQRAGMRSFGVCNTCVHCRQEGPRKYRCGLTEERLLVRETRLICREHAPPAEQ